MIIFSLKFNFASKHNLNMLIEYEVPLPAPRTTLTFLKLLESDICRLYDLTIVFFTVFESILLNTQHKYAP